jgi:alpha-L-fucosidase
MDGKFGIFIHWGVFSVPAWAPTDGKLDQFSRLYDKHPYAEIYMLCMRFKNSPVWEHHVKTYGGNFHYDDFIPQFKAEKWNPDEWVSLFKEAGAKYSVFVSKHSDDFALWPTACSDRNSVQQGPHRDLVGDYVRALRRQDMRVGLYYTWVFNTYFSHYPCFPYTDYIHAQARELIEGYSPDLFWADAEYAVPEQRLPASAWKSQELIAYFYNHAQDASEVLVNDRWGRVDDERLLGDYMTPEYSSMEGIPEFYWETTRGIGKSFGYNQMETEADYESVEGLVRLLVDNVSKNGNLLLNVGPKADGTLEPIQVHRLQGMGKWLQVNGEAIYGTRPWIVPQTQTAEGIDVRFTQKGNRLFAILLGRPSKKVTFTMLHAREGTRIGLLGNRQPLAWTQKGTSLEIEMPAALLESEAYSLEIVEEPYCLLRKETQPRRLTIHDLQRMAFKPHW